jgi:Protein of unknown function (DUF4246)
LKESGIVQAFELGVFKSDTVTEESIPQNLITQVAALENAPQDWHPGSNGQVLDLVHPSLCPLVYGRSKVLESGRTTLEDCIQRCGEGRVLPNVDSEALRRKKSSGVNVVVGLTNINGYHVKSTSTMGKQSKILELSSRIFSPI